MTCAPEFQPGEGRVHMSLRTQQPRRLLNHTWWWLDDSGKPGDEPDRGIGHDAANTALLMSADRLVASGDVAVLEVTPGLLA